MIDSYLADVLDQIESRKIEAFLDKAKGDLSLKSQEIRDFEEYLDERKGFIALGVQE